jgi:hypothetical protein
MPIGIDQLSVASARPNVAYVACLPATGRKTLADHSNRSGLIGRRRKGLSSTIHMNGSEPRGGATATQGQKGRNSRTKPSEAVPRPQNAGRRVSGTAKERFPIVHSGTFERI